MIDEVVASETVADWTEAIRSMYRYLDASQVTVMASRDFDAFVDETLSKLKDGEVIRIPKRMKMSK